MIFARALVFVLLAASPVLAVDINGSWKFRFYSSFIVTECWWDIVQVGDDLTFTNLYGSTSACVLESGTLNGTDLSASGPTPTCEDGFRITGFVNPEATAASGSWDIPCSFAGSFEAFRVACNPSTQGVCDDGNACTLDHCDTSAGTCESAPIVCGDGNLCTTDDCNPASGCAFVNNWNPCNDASVCTTGDVCAGGACIGTPVTCGLCQRCMPASGCVDATPRTDCRQPTASLAAQLMLQDGVNDRLMWKWGSGAATSMDDFADPLTTADYTLCLFDAGGVPRLRARVPAGGTCGGRPCWTRTKTSFRYRSRGVDPDGMQSIALRPGAAGRAKISVRAGGAALDMPTLPLAAGPTLQLENDDTGICWSARHPHVQTGTSTTFKAKGP